MRYLPRRKRVKFKDFTLTVYGIGWLSLLMGRTITRIRHWESQGWLPRPVLKIASGEIRYYTSAELLAYSEIFKRSNVRRHVHTTTTNFAKDCAVFKANLQAAMQQDPKVLGSGINNEAEILRLLKERLENRIAFNIKQIVRGKSIRLTPCK